MNTFAPPHPTSLRGGGGGGAGGIWYSVWRRGLDFPHRAPPVVDDNCELSGTGNIINYNRQPFRK